MSDLGKMEKNEKIEKNEKMEKPEAQLKETSKDVLDCIEEKKIEFPEAKKVFEGFADSISKIESLFSKKGEIEAKKEALNECSDKLQEFKGQNENLDKAIEDVTDTINDISERLEKKEEFSFKDFLEVICELLKALMPIIMAISGLPPILMGDQGSSNKQMGSF